MYRSHSYGIGRTELVGAGTDNPFAVKLSAVARRSSADTPIEKWFQDEKPIGGFRRAAADAVVVASNGSSSNMLH